MEVLWWQEANLKIKYFIVTNNFWVKVKKVKSAHALFRKIEMVRYLKFITDLKIC